MINVPMYVLHCFVSNFMQISCAVPWHSSSFRNQLKAWLIRHLVANNGGDRDLMAKAIAASGRDSDNNLMSGGHAGKGAPGRESSMSGNVRNRRRHSPRRFDFVPGEARNEKVLK